MSIKSTLFTFTRPLNVGGNQENGFDQLKLSHRPNAFGNQENGYDQLKLSHRPKYSVEKWIFSVKIYGCIIFSITLSLSLIMYTWVTKSSSYIALMVILSVLYLSSSTLLVLLLIYLRKNLSRTYEAAIYDLNFNHPTIIYSNRGESISYYLQAGIIIIGLCSVIFICLKVEQNIYYIDIAECRNITEIAFGFCQITFFMIQMVFMIKHNSIVLLAHGKIIKVLMAHIIFTNMSTWTQISLRKMGHMHELGSKSTCSDSVTKGISLYFLPSVAEYSIISMAVFYETLFRIGKVSLIKTSDNSLYEKAYHFSRKHQSIPGIIFANMLSLTTFEIIIIIIVMEKDIPINNLMIFHVSEEFVFFSMGLLMLWKLFQITKHFKFSFPYYISSVDINLLYISAMFSIVYCTQILIFTFFFLLRNEFKSLQHQIILVLRVSAAFIEIVNIIIQTFVIQDSFHRCNEFDQSKDKRPGQNYISSLIGINFSLWLMKSLQLTKADMFFNKSELRTLAQDQSNPLLDFFLYLTMPLSILYRYHATVCLANVFSKIYESESERFENILRAEGFINHKDSRESQIINTIKTDSYDSSSLGLPYRLSQSVINIAPMRLEKRQTLQNLNDAKLRILSSNKWHKKLIGKLKLDSTNKPVYNLK